MCWTYYPFTSHSVVISDLSVFKWSLKNRNVNTSFFFIFYVWPCTARDVTVQKIETIIKEQFAVEMKSKEHEIEVIDQV